MVWTMMSGNSGVGSLRKGIRIPNLPFFYLVFRAWSHWKGELAFHSRVNVLGLVRLMLVRSLDGVTEFGILAG